MQKLAIEKFFNFSKLKKKKCIGDKKQPRIDQLAGQKSNGGGAQW